MLREAVAVVVRKLQLIQLLLLHRLLYQLRLLKPLLHLKHLRLLVKRQKMLNKLCL